MTYQGSIEIHKPIELVTQLFADPASLKEYQDGFVSKELQHGQEGEKGAISKMYYDDCKRKMVLTETILINDLPDLFEAFYHHKHMDNTMRCQFTALGASRTRYDYEVEYTRINWFLPRLMAILFPGMYRRQGDKWMRQFKEFVERQ